MNIDEKTVRETITVFMEEFEKMDSDVEFCCYSCFLLDLIGKVEKRFKLQKGFTKNEC